jgi:hypothetical protein
VDPPVLPVLVVALALASTIISVLVRSLVG